MTAETKKPEPTKAIVDPKAATIRNLLEKCMPQIRLALGKQIDPGHFLRVVMTSIQKNPMLLECEPITLIGAIIQGAQLKLEFDTILGHAYLLPFWNSKKNRRDVQFIPGYKGLIALVRRSEELSSIDTRVVHMKDQFRYGFGTEAYIEHVPAKETDPGVAIAFYAVAKMTNGGTQFDVMLRHEVDAVMRRSPSKDKEGNAVGPWKTDYDEMGKKTVIRRLCKLLPVTIEVQKAISLDEKADLGVAQDLGMLIDASETPTDTPKSPKLVEMPKAIEAAKAEGPKSEQVLDKDGKPIKF